MLMAKKFSGRSIFAEMRKHRSAPRTPDIAPDAPTDRYWPAWVRLLTMAPAARAQRETRTKYDDPMRFSRCPPQSARQIMLVARWSRFACRKPDAISRQYSCRSIADAYIA